jgi:tetratricopeptide (TPR) repeat protein
MLRASILAGELRILRKDHRPNYGTMKNISVFCLFAALAISSGQLAFAQGNKEATKLAQEGSQAAKDQNWNTAVEKFRQATNLDRKYALNLEIAYEQRGFANANDKKFQDAIVDFSEALKINSRNPRVYEQRAAVEMKVNEYDKALADFSEAIKLNPNEVRYYLYRGYIYETKGDIQNSMADTDKALKLQPKNPEALSRKQRLQTRQQSQAPLSPLPPPQSHPPAVPGKTP